MHEFMDRLFPQQHMALLSMFVTRLLIAAILGSAKTGQIGDGKVFVTPLEHAVRIRTGETDADAI